MLARLALVLALLAPRAAAVDDEAKVLRTSADPAARVVAVKALGTLRGRVALSELARALVHATSTNQSERKAVVAVLTRASKVDRDRRVRRFITVVLDKIAWGSRRSRVVAGPTPP